MLKQLGDVIKLATVFTWQKDKFEELEDVGVNQARKVGHAIRDTADKMCLSIDGLGSKSKKTEATENLPVC